MKDKACRRERLASEKRNACLNAVFAREGGAVAATSDKSSK